MICAVAKQAGMTLVEVLVALVIFAIISVAATSLLSNTIRFETRSSERTLSFLAMQRSMQVIEQDLRQVSARSTRDQLGDERAVFLGEGGELMEFTRRGWRNPFLIRRAQSQRLRYEFDGTRLIRSYWPTLDVANDAEPIEQIVFEQLESAQFSFVDHKGNARDFWPPLDSALDTTLDVPFDERSAQDQLASESTDPAAGPGASTDPGLSELPQSPLPIAVSLRLEHALWGTLERSFMLPHGVLTAIAQTSGAGEGREGQEATDEQALDADESSAGRRAEGRR